jgi:serine/threonine protein kinase
MCCRSSIALRTILSIFCQSILALQHCHHPVDGRTIIVHRDIKPENSTFHCQPLLGKVLNSLLVLLMTNGMVKLADFGLSKTLKVSQAVAQSFVGVSVSQQLVRGVVSAK